MRMSLGLNYQILKGLKFTSSFSLDQYFTRVYTFTPSYLKYDKLSEAQGSNIAMTGIQTEKLAYLQPKSASWTEIRVVSWYDI